MLNKNLKDMTYYEKMGLGCDAVLRCEGCKRIVKVTDLVKAGCCPKCSNKRMTEIRTLSRFERFKIKHGFLRFPNSDLFLEEFK